MPSTYCAAGILDAPVTMRHSAETLDERNPRSKMLADCPSLRDICTTLRLSVNLENFAQSRTWCLVCLRLESKNSKIAPVLAPLPRNCIKEPGFVGSNALTYGCVSCQLVSSMRSLEPPAIAVCRGLLPYMLQYVPLHRCSWHLIPTIDSHKQQNTYHASSAYALPHAPLIDMVIVTILQLYAADRVLLCKSDLPEGISEILGCFVMSEDAVPHASRKTTGVPNTSRCRTRRRLAFDRPSTTFTVGRLVAANP